jgi:hypothetical protein
MAAGKEKEGWEKREAAKLARQRGQSFGANPATVSGKLNGDRHWPTRALLASLPSLLSSRKPASFFVAVASA